MRKKKQWLMLFAMVGMLAVVTGCNKENQGELPPTITTAPTKEPVATPTIEPEKTSTPVPTQAPEATATPIPEPTMALDAPFVMVTPVPQEQIADIVGSMTIENYPKVDGSTATLPLSEAVFMAATGESEKVAAEQVVHTKTTNSYKRLYDKEVDLLIVYEPAESIVERMKEEPLCIKPIGLDALVFLANTANPVGSLTTEQLVDIYSGKIDNWSVVGGEDTKLLAFQRPEGSGSQSLMQKLVMKDIEMVSGDNVFRYSTMSDILEGMLSYNGEDNTLGYSVFYYANNMYFEKDLKLMGVNGVVPSTQTIYDGSYDLINAFYAVIRTDEPEDSNARKIFDWLTGEDGQQLVLNLGYVPVDMPEGADISSAKVEQVEKMEVFAKEPLEEGQYFVFLNPQNMMSEFYYGDVTVFDSTWKEVANFYNVTLDYAVQGLYENRYLPVGQIRQSTEGEQVVRYGVYDLEAGAYSVLPTYQNMVILDADKNYYGVPQNEDEENWMNYMIINGVGEVVLPQATMEDWLTISKRGNIYMEYSYDYDNWDNGCTYRIYDENLKLIKVFCEAASALPDDADQIPGVEYYLSDKGCLVDENAEVLISEGLFLERYGNGEDTNCELPFYSAVNMSDENCFGIWYQKKIYLVDRNLDLIRLIEAGDSVYDLPGATFYPEFFSYYDASQGCSVCKTYDGEPVTMKGGWAADDMLRDWNSGAYLLYRRYGATLYAEEHTSTGEVFYYEYPVPVEEEIVNISYNGNHLIVLSFDSGETVEDVYSVTYREVPVWQMKLYYGDSLICEKLGTSDFMNIMEDGSVLWSIANGKRMIVQSESVFEEEDYSYSFYDYVLVNGDKVLYEIDNAYRLSGNASLQFLNGNYVYAVSLNGTECIKALSTFMSLD